MTADAYALFKAGNCTYSNGAISGISGCTCYAGPTIATVKSSVLHIDIPLGSVNVPQLDYVLYNPTGAACSVTKGHWHSGASTVMASWATAAVVLLLAVSSM